MSNSAFSDSEAINLNSTPTNPKICLILMMGLPASGKSTLAGKLVQEINSKGDEGPLKFAISLAYDDFIPLNIQAKIAQASQSKSRSKISPEQEEDKSLTKICRKKFTSCVQHVILHCLKQQSPQEGPDLDVDIDIDVDIDGVDAQIQKKMAEILLLLKNQLSSSILLIIDDNHYYSSMRQEYYSLAKKYGLGFCILYLKKEIRLCLARNKGRPEDKQVPPESIVEMGVKLEPPAPMTHPCDVFAMEVLDGDGGGANIPLLLLVLEAATQNPVELQELEEDKIKIAERERRICSQNEIHQADKILRKWVGSEVALIQEGEDKGEISRALNRRRVAVLEQLKSGDLQIFAKLEGGSEEDKFREEVIQLVNSLKFE